MHTVRDTGFEAPMGEKKILLLSVPAGAGHTRVAEAIHAWARAAGLAADVAHLDATAFATPRLRKVYTDLYLFLVKRMPALWSAVYRWTNREREDGWIDRLRRRIEARDSRPLVDEVARRDPDIVVCTHFLPAEILAREAGSGRLRCRVWVQVTDFDLHRMWVHPHVAGYFAASDEVAFQLRRHGVPGQAIHVTGIPVMPGFAARPGRVECAHALGLDPWLPTVLLMGGGAGLGDLSGVARHLLEADPGLQMIVLAGNNAAQLDALRRLAAAYPGRLAPQGYTERVERLMACADLAVTKPGGSTTAECLAMGLPMIVNAAIPGQEECNANFLLEQGAALKASDLPTLEYRMRSLLACPSRLKAMRARARELGRPRAAMQLLATVLQQAERQDAHP
jgi:processive 1,2-diacylglycerol beta-glucosyltransferase